MDILRNVQAPCEPRTFTSWNPGLFRILLRILILIVLLSSGESRALDRETFSLGAGAGVAGLLDRHKVLLAGFEFRPNLEYLTLRPWMGIEAGYEMIYIAGGVLSRIPLGKEWRLIPSLGAGFFSSREGIELGSRLEFRSALELNHSFADGKSLGILFGHISNADFNTYNPGSELLKITYFIPF